MRKLSEIEPMVRPYVGDCPKFIANQQVVMAARDFMQSSRVWRETSKQTLKADKRSVFMSFMNGNDLVDIAVCIGNSKLSNVGSPGGLDDSLVGTPTAFAINYTELLYFSHAPIKDIEVTITADIKPAITATEIPDDIYSQWAEAIQYRALSKLLMMPRRDWTDLVLAAEFERQYREQLGRAKVQVRSNQNVGSLSIKMNPFSR